MSSQKTNITCHSLCVPQDTGPSIHSTLVCYLLNQDENHSYAFQYKKKKKLKCHGSGIGFTDVRWFSFCLVTESFGQVFCNLMNCSLPGSSVHGISQARILERVRISFSRGSSRPRDQNCVFRIAGRFFTTEPPGKPTCTLTHTLLISGFP